MVGLRVGSISQHLSRTWKRSLRPAIPSLTKSLTKLASVYGRTPFRWRGRLGSGNGRCGRFTDRSRRHEGNDGHTVLVILVPLASSVRLSPRLSNGVVPSDGWSLRL
ncbi:hypothetical protein JAAARDRAFT_525111 [Jaapia argillacea MUCL 33604]|uniref:Uncharacterized protein n=1 Tax=Jaapia argillacea MUCL 33604 TaxID=933084 RepID=A0A067Q4F2_9AGAM|nr:hypothetical protein JAAARDRAFT_525111 [Jaapia argillacea MUCL 33604]